MNNDLGFLLIFIILPTALIVSGFWLILFVRRDPRRDELAQTAIETPAEEILLSPQSDGDSTSEPAEAHAGTSDVDASELAPPVFEPPPAPPEDDSVDDEEAFWTPAAESGVVESHDENAEGFDSGAPPVEPDISGQTEEILPVPAGSDEQDSREPLDQPDSDLETDTDEAIDDYRRNDQAPSQDTANLPNDDAVDPDEDTDGDTRRRRQSGALLVPSTDNVRRRANLGNRRVPPIGKSSTRDEDSVKRPDGD